MKKKKLNLSLKKLSIVILNDDKMNNIYGGVTDYPGTDGCDIIGNGDKSKEVNGGMLCQSKAVANGDPCFG